MDNSLGFDPVIAFSLIGVFLVIGVVLRAKIGALQRFLLPSCLIGGTLGTIFINLGFIDLQFSYFENIAYQFLNISFISIGLTRNKTANQSSINGKTVFRGAFWMVLIKGVVFPLQALIGIILVLGFTMLGYNLFPSFGLFLPLGYVEGPGQALSIAKVYQGFGFQHASSIGLMFATMGYIFCFFLGMPLIRAGLKKRVSNQKNDEIPGHFLKGILPRNHNFKSQGVSHKTLYSENIDNLAFQIALIGVVYLITYSICYGISLLLPAEIERIIWGIFFGVGLGVAVLLSKLLQKLGVDYLVDPGTQNHITGFSLDFMIAGTLMAIQMAVIWENIVPILIISLVGGLLTLFSIVYFGKRQNSLALERTVLVYGIYTGQMSTGLLLLRIVDPDFKSPVLSELGVYPFLVFPFTIAFILLTTGLVAWGWETWQLAAVFGVIMVVSLILLKGLNFWGKPKDLFEQNLLSESPSGNAPVLEN